MTDTEMIDWLQDQARRSYTGISFDWVPNFGESGYRFMRRGFIGRPEPTIRIAIEAAFHDQWRFK